MATTSSGHHQKVWAGNSCDRHQNVRSSAFWVVLFHMVLLVLSGVTALLCRTSRDFHTGTLLYVHLSYVTHSEI